MDLPTPGSQHLWLQRLVGTWRVEGECPGAPGEAPTPMTGTERVRTLGGLWVLAEGEMPGGGIAQSVMTIGFDPAQGAFLGTFVASMMTHLWRYRGTLDAGGDTLTLDTEGPDFGAAGRLARYQDVIALDGEDARSLTSRMQREDGSWQEVMSARYRRIG